MRGFGHARHRIERRAVYMALYRARTRINTVPKLPVGTLRLVPPRPRVPPVKAVYPGCYLPPVGTVALMARWDTTVWGRR